MRTRLGSKMSLLFVMFAVMLAIPAIAVADVVRNDVQVSGGVGQKKVYEAGDPAFSINYYIEQGGNICEAANGTAAQLNLSVTSFPSGASASDININPSSLSLTACDDKVRRVLDLEHRAEGRL